MGVISKSSTKWKRKRRNRFLINLSTENTLLRIQFNFLLSLIKRRWTNPKNTERRNDIYIDHAKI